MDKTPITTLFQKYLNNQIDSEELQELLRYFERSEVTDDLAPLIEKELDRADIQLDEQSVTEIADRAEGRILARTGARPSKKPFGQSRRWMNRGWVQVAAAVLIIVTGAIYFYIKSTYPLQAPISQLADIAPGGNQATLTLPDGRTINLSEMQSGIVVEDGIRYGDGSKLFDNGSLTMDDDSVLNSPPSSINYQLSTPNGGTYQVTLPDGSRVWLNAASTLRYPEQFGGEIREVELEGEGYFEVAKNEHQPFFVKSRGQLVKVVGTAFNINAYPDETDVTTTLVEGVIAIGSAAAAIQPSVEFHMLAPGQQAAFDSGQVRIRDVDVNDYIAWKDGRFVFYGESMPTVIRQIERWYNVSFEHQELAAGIELWGMLSRDVTLSQILEVIELNTPLTFNREGRRVFIRKK